MRQSKCPACAKGWVPSLAPKGKKKEKEVQNPFSKYMKRSLGKRDKKFERNLFTQLLLVL